MKQLKAKIIEHERIAPGFYRMRIGSEHLAKNSRPGQFVEIRCSEGGEVLLRRPLGVHRIWNGGIEVLYEVVGKGTELLSRKKPGEMLDVIGPLGNGFIVPRAMVYGLWSMVLIAGGVGVAPLVALAEALIRGPRSIVHGKNSKLHVLIGARTKSQILCEKDFKKLGCEVKISTEDGSLGKIGLITEQLPKLLSTIDHRLLTIYACGPHPMLKAVSYIADASGIPCQVSMEERMACGVGVCLGCPVKVKSGGYKMVCKEGPAFDAKEIAW
jgi:dihydroorotate dehydrogenase electron transfer subunit